MKRRSHRHEKSGFRDDWCKGSNFYVEWYQRVPAQIERYRSLFGAENVHLVLYDDLKKDALGALEKTLQWLGLEPRAISVGCEQFLVSGIDPAKQGVKEFFRQRPLQIAKHVLSFSPPFRRILTMLLKGSRDTELALKDDVKAQLRIDLEPTLIELERLTGRDLAHWRIRLS